MINPDSWSFVNLGLFIANNSLYKWYDVGTGTA